MRRHSFYLLFAVVLFLCLNTLVYGSSKVREDKLRYNTMYVDAQNTLWIGSDNGLFRWKSSGSVRISLPLTLNITAILASNENLLLGTVEGTLFLYNRLMLVRSCIFCLDRRWARKVRLHSATSS